MTGSLESRPKKGVVHSAAVTAVKGKGEALSPPSMAFELPPVLSNMEEIPERVVYFDSDLRVLWANQTALDSAPDKDREALGLRCFEIWHNRNEPCEECPVIEAFRTGRVQVKTIRSAQGAEWRLRAYPIFDETGRVAGVLEASTDLTGIQRSQKALQESEKKHRHLFYNAPVGLFRARVDDGLVMEGNDQFARILGFESREELIGNYHLSRHYVDNSIRDALMEQLVETGHLNNIEAALYRRDGAVIWARYSVRHFPEEGYLEGVLTEITEAKTAAAELLATEERYRILTENVADGVALIQERQIRLANNALARLLGVDDKDKLIGSRVLDWTLPPFSEEYKRIYAEFERGEWQGAIAEGQFRRADGVEIWLEVNSNVIEWHGKPTLLATARDVTERRLREFEVEEEVQRLRVENINLRSSIKERYRMGRIIGKSSAMQEVYEQILRAAATEASVIVQGESGTGKDLVAQAIHELSSRKDNAFVPVNCGAIPEALLEGEFFGHKKGAFTGAHIDKHGYLDLADGGTLFLDEVGELTVNIQVKLLRAVEGGGYRPLGGTQIKKPDVRIISATNRNLSDLVRTGKMREDFFYRIHVIPIHLPPLRERREDIPLLIEHFLKERGHGTELAAIPGEVLRSLYAHDWPGNIRELQNVLQRYMAMGRLDFLDNNGHAPQASNGAVFEPASPERDLRISVESFERNLILKTLEENQWRRERTARALGVSRKTLFRKMRDHGLM